MKQGPSFTCSSIDEQWGMHDTLILRNSSSCFFQGLEHLQGFFGGNGSVGALGRTRIRRVDPAQAILVMVIDPSALLPWQIFWRSCRFIALMFSWRSRILEEGNKDEASERYAYIQVTTSVSSCVLSRKVCLRLWYFDMSCQNMTCRPYETAKKTINHFQTIFASQELSLPVPNTEDLVYIGKERNRKVPKSYSTIWLIIYPHNSSCNEFSEIGR